METKTLPYLLGLIKWINMFTVLYWQIQIYNTIFGNWVVSLAIAFVITQIVFNVVIGRWLERKYGKENMIDNNIVFRIVSTAVAVVIAIIILLVYQAYAIFVAMIILVMMYGGAFTLISKAKQKGAQNQIRRGGF